RLSKFELTSKPTKAAPSYFELLQEFPFDATIKRMSTVYRDSTSPDKKCWTFVKGSLESILELCTQRMNPDGSLVDIGSETEKKEFAATMGKNMEILASKGLVKFIHIS